MDAGEPETEQSDATTMGQGAGGCNLLLNPNCAKDAEDIHVTVIDTTTTPYSGDGFWYRVDQVDAAGRRVKLNERCWGREGDNVPLEFSDRVVGTYTFLLSTPVNLKLP